MGRIECVTDSYVVVDLETTGFSHFHDVIIEIGAIKYEAGEEIARFNVLIRTDKILRKKIVELTGISNEMLQRDGIEEKDAILKFSQFVGDSVLVGHNFSSFDSKFLEDAYIRSLNSPFTNDYIDTIYLARMILPGLQSYRLGCLAEIFNIDYSKAHRAIEDCVINHMVYEYMAYVYVLCIESLKESSNSSDSGINVTESENNALEDGFLEMDLSEGWQTKMLANFKDIYVGLKKNYFKEDDMDIDDIETEDIATGEELIEADLSEGWRAKMSLRFTDIEKEVGLMEKSFVIMANEGKDGVSSYAIRVYEPDLVEVSRDSSRYTTLARVKENVLKSNINIVEVYSKSFGSLDEKKRFEQDSDELIECLIDCIRYGINNYVPKADGFACCSRYKACSDAKKCIHPNMLYAKACQYRKNIEEGNVFF